MEPEGNPTGDDSPPMSERREPIFEASKSTVAPSLAESVKGRGASMTHVNKAKSPRKNSKDDIPTARDFHDDNSDQEEMDTTMVDRGDVEAMGSVWKMAKRGEKKEEERGSMNALFGYVSEDSEEVLSNEETGNVDRRCTTKETDPDNEKMEDEPQMKKRREARLTNGWTDDNKEQFTQGHNHNRRPASISAEQRFKHEDCKETKFSKNSRVSKKKRYPDTPIRIPKHMKYVAVNYSVDDAYFEEVTSKVAWDCGLWLEDLVVGRKVTLLYGKKPYKATLVAFAPTIEECKKKGEVYKKESDEQWWRKICQARWSPKKEKKEVVQIEPVKEEYTRIDSEIEVEEPKKAVKKPRKTTKKKRRKRWTVPKARKPLMQKGVEQRVSESMNEFEYSDDERNEMEEQKNRGGNDRCKKDSRKLMADTNSWGMEAEANDEMGGHAMDGDDELEVVFDLDLERKEHERKVAEYEEMKRKYEMKMEQKAKKQEEKRKQRENKMKEKHQRELDSAQNREDEERREIVHDDGMGWDDSPVLPPISNHIPELSFLDVKVEDVAAEEDIKVKMELFDETMEREQSPAPRETVANKNSVADKEKEEYIDETKSAIVQENEEDYIVTKKDEKVTVAAMSTVKKTPEKTSTNPDERVQKSAANVDSSLFTVKNELSYADAMWLKDPDVVVISSDDEGYDKTRERRTTSNWAKGLKNREERLLEDDHRKMAKKVAEDTMKTKGAMKTQSMESKRLFESESRLHDMTHARFASAAAKALAEKEANSLPSHGPSLLNPPLWSSSDSRPAWMLQPVGASMHGLAPYPSTFFHGPTSFGAGGAHGAPPNPISARNPVHVSFNPHPVGSIAYASYEWQRANGAAMPRTTTAGMTTPAPSSMQSDNRLMMNHHRTDRQIPPNVDEVLRQQLKQSEQRSQSDYRPMNTNRTGRQMWCRGDDGSTTRPSEQQQLQRPPTQREQWSSSMQSDRPSMMNHQRTGRQMPPCCRADEPATSRRSEQQQLQRPPTHNQSEQGWRRQGGADVVSSSSDAPLMQLQQLQQTVMPYQRDSPPRNRFDDYSMSDDYETISWYN